MTNPKLDGSGIVDCIPQTGRCPVGCIECFYNGPGWYRSREEPLIPSVEEVRDKVVRMNSGHDSNIERELVLRVASRYDDVFFNTSLPYFDFAGYGPVVFTCNGGSVCNNAVPDSVAHFVTRSRLDNIMFVRMRVNTWNLDLAEEVVGHYTRFGVPVVMTFMRYASNENIPESCLDDFVWKTHVSNSYYILSVDIKGRIMSRWEDNDLVYMCGTYESSLCRDCGNCYDLYWRWKDDRG